MNLIQKTNKLKGVAVFDLDGTIINGQSQFLFLNFLVKNKKVSIFSITPLLIWFLLYKFNLVSSPNKAFGYALKIFQKLTYEELSKLAIDFTNDEYFNSKKNKKILELIEKHKKEGNLIILLSTAIDIITKKISEQLKIDYCISSVVEQEKNKIINIKVVNGLSKLDELKSFFKKNNLETENTYAYGDDISDLPVLMFAKHRVAVNPSRKLKKYAKNNNWIIIY
jgi:HAD superfamily hydrolase (TIGR01490 family)